MAEYTSELGLPYPALAGGDTPDVPRDVKALADKVEQLLLQHAGDLKLSARTADHGRWLLCDGRELSQAEIESALSLPAGGGAAVVAVLKTGSSSVYGTAASGKVKLPDFRDRMPMIAGSAHPMKGSGSEGGAETVKLTSAQSGLPTHGHTFTDPGHSHGVTDPGHSHGASTDSKTPAVTVANGSTGVSAATDDRQPTVWSTAAASTTGIYGYAPPHSHANSQDGFVVRKLSGGSFKVGSGNIDAGIATWTGTQNDSNLILYDGGHGHSVSSSQATHRHTVTISDPGHGHSASQAAHSHAVSVSSGSTGIGVQSAQTGATVNGVAGAGAAEAHENMPPYRTAGNAFIRV